MTENKFIYMACNAWSQLTNKQPSYIGPMTSVAGVVERRGVEKYKSNLFKGTYIKRYKNIMDRTQEIQVI